MALEYVDWKLRRYGMLQLLGANRPVGEEKAAQVCPMNHGSFGGGHGRWVVSSSTRPCRTAPESDAGSLRRASPAARSVFSNTRTSYP